jgi:thioredoxin 1
MLLKMYTITIALREYSDRRKSQVDVDTNDETAAACKVSCMPTFQFYKNGNKVGEFSGADEKKLAEMVEKLS